MTRYYTAVAAHVDLGIFPATPEPAGLRRLADLMHTAGMLTSPLSVTPLLHSASG